MFESHKKTAIILVGIIVAITVVLYMTLLFTQVSIEHAQSSNLVQANSNSSQTSQQFSRVPPPIPLSAIGIRDSFEHAKSVTGLSWASLPTQVPPNLVLQSVRYKDNHSYVDVIDAIYTPPGITASDNDTLQKINDEGDIIITYSLQLGGPTANLTKNMEIMTRENPSLLQTVNGHHAIVTPHDIQINAGICMGKTNCWLTMDIGSEKYNSAELRPIAESIAILSHD